MTTMASAPKAVIGGVDTHADAHVAAVCDQLGAVLGTRSFPTTARGYRQLLAWLRSFGSVEKVGVEGTGSYGVGLTRVLLAAEVEVVEVLRPNRQTRRRHDKTDVVDAVAAARAVLTGDATGQPKAHDGCRVTGVTEPRDGDVALDWTTSVPLRWLRPPHRLSYPA